MFTGIIEEIGVIQSVHSGSNSGSLTITACKVLQDVQTGDSIAVNGVCLTVTAFTGSQFTADVMPVTLAKSNLGELRAGQRVNLERALQAQSRLGGHFVSGHIDCTGTVVVRQQDANALRLEIAAPDHLKDFTIPQGSIAIDGISLTIAELTPRGVVVSLIPHTAAATALLDRKIGDRVNLEADMIGKYLHHFWLRGRDGSRPSGQSSGITREFLSANGFL